MKPVKIMQKKNFGHKKSVGVFLYSSAFMDPLLEALDSDKRYLEGVLSSCDVRSASVQSASQFVVTCIVALLENELKHRARLASALLHLHTRSLSAPRPRGGVHNVHVDVGRIAAHAYACLTVETSEGQWPQDARDSLAQLLVFVGATAPQAVIKSLCSLATSKFLLS